MSGVMRKQAPITHLSQEAHDKLTIALCLDDGANTEVNVVQGQFREGG